MWPGVTTPSCGMGDVDRLCTSVSATRSVGRMRNRDSGRPPRPARSRSGRRTARAARARRRRAGRQLRKQLVRARELAGDRVADADRDRRRRSLAFFDHVEVVIEGRHFVDLGHRHLHFGGERDQMRAPTDSRSGPESCAGARSAGRGGAAHRRAGPGPLRAPSDRRVALSAWSARRAALAFRAGSAGWRDRGSLMRTAILPKDHAIIS